MSFIAAIKQGKIPSVTPEVAIMMIILNIVPLTGLGTLIAAYVAEPKDKDIIQLGFFQLLLDVPWFVVLFPLMMIPIVNIVVLPIWFACIFLYLAIRLANLVLGVFLGIKTYTAASQARGPTMPPAYPPQQYNPVVQPAPRQMPVQAQGQPQQYAQPVQYQ
ncbi:hypothetical protein J8273_2535 [Carpediemonas membranifera]|uniref:Uncharacterized protein n=1 Tax=Carpediemonas membranifera TaxID=201153 RepID=A0A8J6B5N0_9EUKA|nr:hypothetical protein J8273_2535 [Carpediemonas membranifera]|eukprot:KAG9396183.1 hypothetical protein J8273_2535 [Carpediemonas membranifera]